MSYNTTSISTQNQLLLNHLMDYYKDSSKLKCMTNIINEMKTNE